MPRRRINRNVIVTIVAAVVLSVSGLVAYAMSTSSTNANEKRPVAVAGGQSSKATPSASATESRTPATTPSERDRSAPQAPAQTRAATSAAPQASPTVPTTRKVTLTLWVNQRQFVGKVSGADSARLTLFVDGKKIQEGNTRVVAPPQGREAVSLEAHANGHLVGKATIRLTDDAMGNVTQIGLVEISATYDGKAVTATSGRAIVVGNPLDMEAYLIRNYGSDREVFAPNGKELTAGKDKLMPPCAIESIQKEDISSTCGARLVYSQPTHADSVEMEVKSSNGQDLAYVPVDARLYPANLG